MTIPDFQSIMLPLLRLSSDGEVHSLREATNNLAHFYELTDDELKVLIPSGPRKFDNRVGWARTHLKKAGLLVYPRRGCLQITQRGSEVLDENPAAINMNYLERFPEYVEFRNMEHQGLPVTIEVDEGILTPEESMEIAYLKIRGDLIDNLLDYILRSSPDFFERLVVELLVAMGYGGTHNQAARALGMSGDGGVDGIIYADRLGLEHIYIQAKRWSFDNRVGSPNIRDFVGALHGHHAKKGVFITTSDFTNDAYEYIRGIETKVVLINGKELANLMIDFGIGVSTKTEYKIYELDTDFFGEFVEE